MSERQVCTADAPFTKGAEGRWCHPDANELDATYSMYGSYAIYQCPHCGHRWTEELAD